MPRKKNRYTNLIKGREQRRAAPEDEASSPLMLGPPPTAATDFQAPAVAAENALHDSRLSTGDSSYEGGLRRSKRVRDNTSTTNSTNGTHSGVRAQKGAVQGEVNPSSLVSDTFKSPSSSPLPKKKRRGSVKNSPSAGGSVAFASGGPAKAELDCNSSNQPGPSGLQRQLKTMTSAEGTSSRLKPTAVGVCETGDLDNVPGGVAAEEASIAGPSVEPCPVLPVSVGSQRSRAKNENFAKKMRSITLKKRAEKLEVALGVQQSDSSTLSYVDQPPVLRSRTSSESSDTSVSSVSSIASSSTSRLTDVDRRKRSAENSRRYRLRKKAEREAIAARSVLNVTATATSDERIDALSQKFESAVRIGVSSTLVVAEIHRQVNDGGNPSHDVVLNFPENAQPEPMPRIQGEVERMDVVSAQVNDAVEGTASPPHPILAEAVLFPAADNDDVVEALPVAPEDRVQSRYAALNDSWRTVEKLDVGRMTSECVDCGARYFPGEANKRDRRYTKCCAKGKVQLSPYPGGRFPQVLRELFLGDDELSRNFHQFIRNYNNSFSLGSVRVPNDRSFYPGRDGRTPFIFRVQGQIRHVINTRLRSENDDRALFYYDPEEAIRQRMGYEANAGCQEEVFNVLETMFRDVNPFVEGIRFLKDVLAEEEERVQTEGGQMQEVCLVFATRPDTDPRRFNAPRCNEVAAVFAGRDGAPPPMQGLRIYTTRGGHVDLSPTDARIDAMCYPIFYPLGDRGWHVGMPLVVRGRQARGNVSMCEYYSYRFQVRGDFNPLLQGSRLTQEYLAGTWAKVQGSRLEYIRQNQRQIRAECYQGLVDHLELQRLRAAEERGQSIEIGRMVILPSNFIGSPRYMQQTYQDAMAIVAKEGRPDLFITITCNPNWPEIRESLGPHEKVEHRPDIAVRVFHLKLQAALDGILKQKWFGRVVAWFYTIEFQKRGLPHCHLLVILHPDDKPREPSDIDEIISCELPDKDNDPELYAAVVTHMIHGPCGVDNPRSPCMKDNVCGKKFPKPFNETTRFSMNGYPLYKRPANDRFAVVRGTRLDNSFVVPYNRYLLLRLDCHVNVESCSSMKAVKYLCKYVHKGHDSASIAVTTNDQVAVDNAVIVHDEIDDYVEMRYVTASEAIYRLYEYELHDQSHVIHRLPVHLPNRQTVYFHETDNTERLAAVAETTQLTAWFELNARDPNANQYLYTEVAYHYTWHKQTKEWRPRQRRSPMLCRMYHVSMRDTERYFLRLLLLHVRGPTSFVDVRTYLGQTYDTFREAAMARGLIENDQEAVRCLEEAVVFAMPPQLRGMFALVVIFNNPPNKLELWNRFKDDLSEDFTRRNFDQEVSYTLALSTIKRLICQYQSDFDWAASGLPHVDDQAVAHLLATEDLHADLTVEQEARVAEELRDQLNADQRTVFNRVMTAVDNESVVERYFHLDGPAGSGKSFLYNALIHQVKSTGQSVVAVASTGIAATLLEGGSTAHSAFKLPVPLTPESTSGISRNSKAAPRIRNAKLIIWDEITMSPHHALTTVDRLLKDLCPANAHLPFAGKCVVVGGDFRQCLPVVTRGRTADVLEACVTNCSLWRHFEKLRLTTNVRTSDPEFARWLLEIGSGTSVRTINSVPKCVEIPDRFIVDNVISRVYGDRVTLNTVAGLSNHVNLSPFNEDVNAVNEQILERVGGDEPVTYYSIDSHVCGERDELEMLINEYSIEFLNSVTPTGMPPHKLNLKVGAMVMLIRNINVAEGLMNGGRFIVRALGTHFIQIESCFGRFKGKLYFLPRIFNESSKDELPFQLRRKQFPVRLAFAMTINKSQGQSFDTVGLILHRPVFSHGQLYVALSRSRSPDGLFIQIIPGRHQGSFISEEESRSIHYTKNVVYNLDALH